MICRLYENSFVTTYYDDVIFVYILTRTTKYIEIDERLHSVKAVGLPYVRESALCFKYPEWLPIDRKPRQNLDQTQISQNVCNLSVLGLF